MDRRVCIPRWFGLPKGSAPTNFVTRVV